MASRRVIVSSALRASSAIRPARSAFTVAARTTRLSIAFRVTAPFANSARCYSAKSESKKWDFEDLRKLVETDKDENIVIVDVREPTELYQTGKIPGAINIPITTAAQSFHIPEEDFEDMYGFERPDKTKELLFYCKAGVRARAAAQLAQHAGWKKVGDYPGSWLDWETKDGPVEPVQKHGKWTPPS
ncbi:hypothetical protein ACHAPI_003384 [Fusarium lateritium]